MQMGMYLYVYSIKWTPRTADGGGECRVVHSALSRGVYASASS